MRSIFLTAAAAAALIPAAGHAQDSDATGFYVGANVGVATLDDVPVQLYDAGGTFGGTGAEDTADASFDPKSAATFGGTVGYDFGMIRGDLEVAYARNRLRSVTFNRVNGTAVTLDADDRADVCDYLELDTCAGTGNTFQLSGTKLRQLSAMANVWLDLPVGERFVPYVGGGVGIAGYEVDGEGKGKFAWQLGAGGAFRLGGKTYITADYRHRQAGSTEIAYDANSGLRLGKLKSDSFTVGVRFGF